MPLPVKVCAHCSQTNHLRQNSCVGCGASFKRGRPKNTKSNIYFNGTSQRWRLQSLLQPSKFMETEGDLSSLIPIGSYSWKTGSKNSWCSKPEGFTTDLTFSQCYPNKYTCDSGYCIPLHQRCNTEHK